MATSSGSGSRNGSPPKPGSSDSNSGIYPSESIEEDKCKECMGFSRDCRIHPKRAYTRGPAKWYQFMYGTPPPRPGFIIDEQWEFNLDAEERLPYQLYYTKDAKPYVNAFIGASMYEEQEKDEEPIELQEEVKIMRGVPNYTSRGGGPRRYHFGRGVPETHFSVDDKDLPATARKAQVSFYVIREPHYNMWKSSKEVGRGHYWGGGTQRPNAAKKCPAVVTLDSDSDDDDTQGPKRTQKSPVVVTLDSD